MEIKISKEENAVIIFLKGRLDTITSPELEEKAVGLINEGKGCIIINCKDLEYISSAGLRVFLIMAKKLKAVKGTVLISNLTGVAKEVFDISGFASFLQICETEEEARKQI